MKLIVKKNQADKKGLFGNNKGVNFSLDYKVSLTPEEQNLISKYKIEKEVLMTNESGVKITIQDMIKGRSLTVQNINTLQNNEQVAINVCKNFKRHIDILRSFGGEYSLDFRSDGIYDELEKRID